MRTIIVGTGIAGLVCALAHPAPEDVLVLTKADPRASNTDAAQGGIAAVTRPPAPGDSIASHVADTLTAGAGLCDAEAVQTLCGDGPDRIADLIAAGVPFDRTPDGALSRGLEAAHSVARILHAGGDATGAGIAGALLAAVTHRGIEIRPHTLVTELITDGGRVRGVRTLTPGGAGSDGAGSDRVAGAGVVQEIQADAVVLATGGAGQLYPYTSNPDVATADGVALAARVGAVLADLEFYQFHPTTLALPGNFLVSEAVRGEGAVLRDSAGSRFMIGVHPDAELAPRDVVARAVADRMRETGAPVVLDATRLGDRLAGRFPSIDAAVRSAGLDWAREPVPITPAAHYWMGGVATDLAGRTSIPGLYAVGEVARTGVHGANRLASNSLLEGAVFGHRAALSLTDPTPLSHTPALDVADQNEPAITAEHPAGATVSGARADLQRVMWDAVGLGRDDDGLAQAEETLAGWTAAGATAGTVAEHETANLLLVARLMARAARARTRSAGAHFRTDDAHLLETAS
ncbi:L-aspartate oxidase [Ruania alkalisoli]|uniref:L-aspartate oxidase n=1 Tax=Ruania alkalisoli TaxID=2779775 RepID=A0A7M1SVR6_9MICO|nr:L-aspartate oxidase [Ruania alkalisoli]QOR71670.1 L-aspartate oxidase [Ruania alkalisoli]